MNYLMQNLLSQRYSHTLTDLLDELLEDPEALDLFVEFHPDLWSDLAEQGYSSLDLGQSTQASNIFSFLLQHHEEEVAFHAAYADSLCSMKQYLGAAEYYHNASLMAPDIPDAKFYLAEIYMMFKHPSFANEQLEQIKEKMAEEKHPLAELIPQRIQFSEEAMTREGVAR